MTHEVFISYSHHDKLIADGVCANLEAAGIRCWIAPRDIAPGHDWPTSISEAITNSRVMLLIFSSRSNKSRDVGRELILASDSNCIIVPFKIEDVEPEPGKKYYLARTHWMDAMDPPTQEQIDKLVSCVHSLLVEAGVVLAVKPPQEKADVEAAPQPTSKPINSVPSKPASPALTRARPSRALAWILGTLVLCGLLVGGGALLWTQRGSLPIISSWLATQTSTVTSTLQPTFTITLAPTKTRTPSSTIDPATGIVSGMIKFGAHPFEGVTVKLCTDWLYTCRGSEITTVTDSKGEYTFTGVEPGEYQFITQTPDQNYEERWEEWVGSTGAGYDPVIISVTGGRKVSVDPHTICKHDLVVHSPTIVGGSVTVSWDPYPGASSYSFESQTGGFAEHHFSSTSISSTFSPGSYSYVLSADGPEGLCVRKSLIFTVP